MHARTHTNTHLYLNDVLTDICTLRRVYDLAEPRSMQQRRATRLVNARTERERTRERKRERKIDKQTDSQAHTICLSHTQRRTKLNACVHQRASLCFVYHVVSIWQLHIPHTHTHTPT